MQLSNRLSHWQWAGLAAFVLIALITVFRSSAISTQDPISVSLNTNGTATETKNTLRQSKFHLLIPASGPHFRVCRAIASATMMGYPVPVLNGWMQEGDLDASKSHLAKVRTTMKYLESLPESTDDDLMLMIDGYDVTFQIPLDVMIERYFALNRAANAKIAARFGVDSTDALAGDDTPRQTILFGAEKICYPLDMDQMNRVGCWAIPHDVDIPDGAFGPSDGNWAHNIPLWLNSGTIIGPVRDMRRMFGATLERIEKFYNPGNEFSDSDQKYMSDVWGVQEYSRSIKELELYFHGDVFPTDVVPDPDSGKIIPELEPDQETEYHIGIDYRSALFQTHAGSEHYVEFLTYNATLNGTSIGGRPSTWVTRDVSSGSHNFKPYQIFLPNNLVSSIMRMFRSIAHVVDAIPLINELPLQTNIVTKNVYGLFHYTGEKDHLDDIWGQMWFYPYGRELFEAALKTLNPNHTIAMADGRRWVHAHTIPESSEEGYRAAGALDDEMNWLEWEQLCEIYESKLFVKKSEA